MLTAVIWAWGQNGVKETVGAPERDSMSVFCPETQCQPASLHYTKKQGVKVETKENHQAEERADKSSCFWWVCCTFGESSPRYANSSFSPKMKISTIGTSRTPVHGFFGTLWKVLCSSSLDPPAYWHSFLKIHPGPQAEPKQLFWDAAQNPDFDFYLNL